MRPLAFTLLLSSCLLLNSCFLFNNCIEPKGEFKTNLLSLEKVNSIELSSSIDVVVKQSDQQRIELTAPENYFEALNKEVDKKGEWNIHFDPCLRTTDKVSIVIEVEELNEIEINGSGNVKGEGVFTGSDLELEINGSGNISIEVDNKEVEAEIQGSGDIVLSGVTKKVEVEINGSGDVDAENLMSDKSEVQINGSGDVKVNATNSLKVEVNGSGDVSYKGSPKDIDSSINGSGELKKIP